MCHDCYKVPADAPLTAIQFLPALRAFTLNDQEEIDNFLNNPETNHVIVRNDLIKIVLIRWDPGAECNIHGHSDGGCVLKVLKGKIMEMGNGNSVDDLARIAVQNNHNDSTLAIKSVILQRDDGGMQLNNLVSLSCMAAKLKQT